MILLYPDPFLTKVVPQSISVKGEDILRMIRVMQKHGAIGLAANQIGLNERIIVIAPNWIFINPVIVKSEAMTQVEEQCLSIPGQIFQVTRAMEIDVEYQNLELKLCKQRFYNDFAQVFQHETDHLNGILINAIQL